MATMICKSYVQSPEVSLLVRTVLFTNGKTYTEFFENKTKSKSCCKEGHKCLGTSREEFFSSNNSCYHVIMYREVCT